MWPLWKKQNSRKAAKSGKDFDFCCQNYGLSSFYSIRFLDNLGLLIEVALSHDSEILLSLATWLAELLLYLRDEHSFFHSEKNFQISLKVNHPTHAI